VLGNYFWESKMSPPERTFSGNVTALKVVIKEFQKQWT
jgi:hypothetical protein